MRNSVLKRFLLLIVLQVLHSFWPTMSLITVYCLVKALCYTEKKVLNYLRRYLGEKCSHDLSPMGI